MIFLLFLIGVELGPGKRGQAAIVHAGEPVFLTNWTVAGMLSGGILIESEDERTLDVDARA